MTIDNTSQCAEPMCKFCILDESDRAKILCFCKLDERWRIWGSHLECNRKEYLTCVKEGEN